MGLTLIGWILLGTGLTVVVIAAVLSKIMFPSALFEPPHEPSTPEPEPSPPPNGVQDLKEYRRGHWR